MFLKKIILLEITTQTLTNLISTKNIIQIKEVEDYRYYFSEGINYIIYTLRGTNDFLKKTYNIKTLPDNPLRSIVLVVEHTVTRNKYFFFKEEITTEEDLINVFFNQN